MFFLKYILKRILNFIKLKIKIKNINGVKIKSYNISSDIELDEYVQIPKNVRIMNNVKIGKATYLSPNTVIESNVKIGKYCSIAPNVYIAPGEHYTNYITTHPIIYNPYWRKIMGIKEEPGFLNEIGKQNSITDIGNDVWIGLNVIIMRGIKIGDGAVIGAGSIVTKDVPPYAIVGGCPARIIRYRFDKKEIDRLLKNRWWDKPIVNINDMYKTKVGD